MDLTGDWQNQNGSILRIQSVVKSLVTGLFRSAKGRAAEEEIYSVIGCLNGDLITLTVDFRNENGNLGSIANFTGRIEDGSKIHTIWVLARAFSDAEGKKPTELWNTFLVNHDVFTKIT
ncbi:MAG: avidin/streptavidin family protein [Gammaproteobacteria bacterium]|nr:avidin/streptavidin family protein [Gammaproteobacteria bacterium]